MGKNKEILSSFTAFYFKVILMMREKDRLKAKGKKISKKILMLSEQAVIKQKQMIVKLSDLEVGDTIIIIGSSDNNGEISAKMVRVSPF